MEKLITFLEKISRFAYQWFTNDDEILGEIIYRLHIFGSLTLIVVIILSHTVYPVFWFQFVIFCFVFSVWIQHIILQTCIITVLESKFFKTNDRPFLIDGVLRMFGMPVQADTQIGITLLISTLCTLFLGLEISSRTAMYVRSMFGASEWI